MTLNNWSVNYYGLVITLEMLTCNYTVNDILYVISTCNVISYGMSLMIILKKRERDQTENRFLTSKIYVQTYIG